MRKDLVVLTALNRLGLLQHSAKSRNATLTAEKMPFKMNARYVEMESNTAKIVEVAFTESTC